MPYGDAIYGDALYGGLSLETGNPLQMPDISVEFSPTAMFGTLNWIDITRHVLNGTTTFGRQHELDRVEAAILTLTMDNRSGKFNRFDTGGEYYFAGSGLVPGNPVRVTATWNGVTYPVYYGYMTSCLSNETDAVNATATIMAADQFKNLAIQPMSNPVLYANLVVADGATAFWRFDDDIAEQLTTRATAVDSIAGHTATISGLTVGQQAFDQPGPIYIDPATALTLPIGGLVGCPAGAVDTVDSGPWTLEMWVSGITGNAGLYGYAGPASTSGMFFIGPGHVSGGLEGQVVYGTAVSVGQIFSTILVNDGNPHYIVITGTNQTGGFVSMYVDGGWQGYAEMTGQSAPWLATYAFGLLCDGTSSSVTIANLAFYSGELSSAQAANHYAVGAAFQSEMLTGDLIASILTFCGVPEDLQNIEPGNTMCQGVTSDLTQTNALDFCTVAQQTEDGILFCAPDGIVTFLDRYFPIDTVSQATLADQYLGALVSTFGQTGTFGLATTDTKTTSGQAFEPVSAAGWQLPLGTTAWFGIETPDGQFAFGGQDTTQNEVEPTQAGTWIFIWNLLSQTLQQIPIPTSNGSFNPPYGNGVTGANTVEIAAGYIDGVPHLWAVLPVFYPTVLEAGYSQWEIATYGINPVVAGFSLVNGQWAYDQTASFFSAALAASSAAGLTAFPAATNSFSETYHQGYLPVGIKVMPVSGHIVIINYFGGNNGVKLGVSMTAINPATGVVTGNYVLPSSITQQGTGDALNVSFRNISRPSPNSVAGDERFIVTTDTYLIAGGNAAGNAIMEFSYDSATGAFTLESSPVDPTQPADLSYHKSYNLTEYDGDGNLWLPTYGADNIFGFAISNEQHIFAASGTSLPSLEQGGLPGDWASNWPSAVVGGPQESETNPGSDFQLASGFNVGVDRSLTWDSVNEQMIVVGINGNAALMQPTFPLAAGPNLVIDGGFTESPIGDWWEGFFNSSIANVANANFTSGSCCAVTRTAAGTGLNILSAATAIAVTPGQNYKLTAHVMAPATPRQCAAYMLWNSVDSVPPGAKPFVLFTDTTSGVTTVSCFGVAPPGATTMLPQIQALACANGETVWIGDVTFETQPATSSPPPVNTYTENLWNTNPPVSTIAIQVARITGTTNDQVNKGAVVGGQLVFTILKIDNTVLQQTPGWLVDVNLAVPPPTYLNYAENPAITQDDLDLWTVVQTTRINGQLQQAVNNAAVDTYGQRMVQGLTSLLMLTDSEALDLANWILTRFYIPIPRVSSVTLSSTADGGANFPTMLGTDLWTQVTFRRATAPGQVNPFVQANVVEQIAHKWQPDRWDTTYALSPYELDFNVFTLGGSVSGCTLTSNSQAVSTTAANGGNFGAALTNFSVTGIGIATGTSVIAVGSGLVGTDFLFSGTIFSGICSGPDGNLWAADGTGAVWKVTTAGIGTRYGLTGSNPNSICAGPDGNLWVGDGSGATWKVTTSGIGTRYALTAHIPFPTGICSGPDGNLWMADDFEGAVWKITTSGVATKYNLLGSNPVGICVGSDNNLWVADEGGGGVWKVTTSGVGTQYTFAPPTFPTSICSGPDGNLWVTDQGPRQLHKVTTSGAVTPYLLQNSSANGICVGSDNNLWVTDGYGKLWQVTTAGIALSYDPVGNLGPVGICNGPDSNLWMAGDDAVWQVPVVNTQTITLSNSATSSGTRTLSFSSPRDLLDADNVLAY
jgi:virginiamycin B lyase